MICGSGWLCGPPCMYLLSSVSFVPKILILHNITNNNYCAVKPQKGLPLHGDLQTQGQILSATFDSYSGNWKGWPARARRLVKMVT